MNSRSAAIIIDDGRLLLIHRLKGSKDYWVLPGGSVEPGEGPEEACCREVREEAGLEIEIVKPLTKLLNRGREEFYFLARRTSGEARLGGPELRRMTESDRYELKWILIEDLPRCDLHPIEIRTLLAELGAVGG